MEDQFEWDILVPDFGEVWLRGAKPGGYPTQTWVNGELLQHEPDGVQGWETESGLPTPVWFANRLVELYADDPETLCYLLGGEEKLWMKPFEGQSLASNARHRAFTHHVRGLILLHCADQS